MKHKVSFHQFVQASISVLAVLSLVSCVTVNSQTVQDMSNGMLCELLGPTWVTTVAERDANYRETERRGISCINGRVAGNGRTPSAGESQLEKPTASPGFGSSQESTRESPTPSAADICSMIDGASLFADDETYLGKLTNKYNSDSIYNEYGTHGSKYSSESIWNKYSSYGSKYSSSSPWNKYSSSGPLILKDGEIIGQLTINKYAPGAVNPTMLGALCFDSDRGNPN